LGKRLAERKQLDQAGVRVVMKIALSKRAQTGELDVVPQLGKCVGIFVGMMDVR
jgi:hypothetical protein